MNSYSPGYCWRVVAAGFSYLLFAIGAMLPGVYITVLGLLPLDKQNRQLRARRVIRYLCRFYIETMQFLRLYSYEVDGTPPNNLSGHVVIANHSMLIDALFVLAYVENVCCVVKSSLATNLFTRVAVASAGYLRNDEAQLLECAVQKLKSGENVLIFPEGTRSTSTQQLDFRRGAANLAVLSGAPILPVMLCSAPGMLGKNERWYQLPSEKPRVFMKFFAPLQIESCIDITQLRTIQYRRLTQYLQDFYEQAMSQWQGNSESLNRTWIKEVTAE